MLTPKRIKVVNIVTGAVVEGFFQLRQYSLYDEGRERLATPIRQDIMKLKADLLRREEELRALYDESVYAGVTPPEGLLR